MAPRWTMQDPYVPSGRPLAEPPILNYEKLVEEKGIPSDIRLRRLFAKDIALGYKWRDQMTEYRLLREYHKWTRCMLSNEADDSEQGLFYKGLQEELNIECIETSSAADSAIITLRDAKRRGIVNEIGWWEYRYLDEDGGTTRIQDRLSKGDNIFRHERQRPFFEPAPEDALTYEGGCKLAFEKYGHLAPPELYAALKKQFEYPLRRAAERALNTETVRLGGYEAVEPASDAVGMAQPSAEHQLSIAVAENAALQERIAKLERERGSAQKPDEHASQSSRSLIHAGGVTEARRWLRSWHWAGLVLLGWAALAFVLSGWLW